MKINYSNILFLFPLIIIITISCQKQEPELPGIKTKEVTEVTRTSALTGGIILNDGNDKIIEKGVWCKTANDNGPDTTVIKGTGSAEFTSYLTGLLANTTYEVRAYATNSVGKVFGEPVIFTTDTAVIPEVSTSEVSIIRINDALCGGDIISDGASDIIKCGVCWSASPNPTMDDSTTTDALVEGKFSRTITGLTALSTYYVRAYATNNVGTGYGEEKTFTTYTLPTVITTPATSWSPPGATVGGEVISDGGTPVRSRGICWSLLHNPTINGSKSDDGTDIGTFSSQLTGLKDSIVYYVRAYAVTDAGTGYGNEISFGTDQKIVRDIDGNVYHVIRIGSQLWMQENLKVTHYSDGTPINYLTQTKDEGAYMNYNDDENIASVYGRLYNPWAASDLPALAPAGWRVPYETDIKALAYFLTNGNISWNDQNENIVSFGGTLKEPGFAHWLSPNAGANNSTGFTALPGGNGYTTGTNTSRFSDLGIKGTWLTSTSIIYKFSGSNQNQTIDFIGFELNSDNELMRVYRAASMIYINDYARYYPTKKISFYSIRCVRY